MLNKYYSNTYISGLPYVTKLCIYTSPKPFMEYIIFVSMHSHKQQYSDLIKAEAKRLGFMFCGIAKAGFLEEEAPRLEAWLKQGMQGEMQYMENHFDKR